MLADRALALLVPPACLACRAPLRAPADLCTSCRAALPWLDTSRCCERCALPRPCGPPCPAQDAAFASSWAPLAHEGAAAKLVVALKEHGRIAAAKPLAAFLTANVPPAFLDEAVVVPAPPDPRRKRQRGLDHAKLIAQAVTQRTGAELRSCLRRGRGGRRVGSGRAVRLHDGAAVAVHGNPPPIALLVDDVHTTGATLDACARALLAGGSREVRAITVTRALG